MANQSTLTKGTPTRYAGLMRTMLQDTKFKQIDFFGDYERSPFSPTESRNLVAVAMK